MKKSLKPLLCVLVLVMSVSLIMVFSSGGCRRAVSPVEESVIEEPVVEEVTSEPEEEPSEDKDKEIEERWEGLWYQEDPGEYAFRFTADGKWELGWKGDDFFAETFGNYILEEDKIIFYSGNEPDAEPLICERIGDIFWFGTGEVTISETEGVEGPNLVTIGPDGKYDKH